VRRRYGNEPTAVDGIPFASKAEARRYGELKLLQAAGEIRDLDVHPRFELVHGVVLDGRKKSALVYVADFAYRTGDGVRVVEDVKSPATATNPVYRLKRHLMKALLYIDVQEVG
jgi:hypothetical protein